MSAERSRQTFDPQLDFLGVLMQPGRVLLDADWNEFIEILDRRIRLVSTSLSINDRRFPAFGRQHQNRRIL